MADDTKQSKFGLGLLMGTVLGGLAALFLSPTTGEENRKLVAKKIKELEKLLEENELDKKVGEVFGEVSDDLRNLYKKAKKQVVEKLAEMKETIENIDKKKYENVVTETVAILKKEVKQEAKDMERLKEALLKEWKKLEVKKKK